MRLKIPTKCYLHLKAHIFFFTIYLFQLAVLIIETAHAVYLFAIIDSLHQELLRHLQMTMFVCYVQMALCH